MIAGESKFFMSKVERLKERFELEAFEVGGGDFLGAKVIGYVFSNSELERIFSNSNFFYYLVISFYFFQLFEILFLKIISKIFVAKSQEI